MILARAAVILLCLTVAGPAAVIYVPDDFARIQDAIAAASTGDTIIVRPGTYGENIDFSGKDIHLKSELGPAFTVIDGNQTGPVATFAGGEGPAAVLEGFSLVNGDNPASGGGIVCLNASPGVIDNIITANRAGGGGGAIHCSSSTAYIGGNIIFQNKAAGDCGGIHCYDNAHPTIFGNRIYANTGGSNSGGIACVSGSSPTISGNTITHNASFGAGAGIYCISLSSPTIVNNIIAWNSVSAATAGGIYCGYSSNPEILNNTIYGNSSINAGGLFSYSSDPVVTNTIIWNNKPNQVYSSGGGSPVITYCDVQGGWTGTGNIDADPLCVAPSGDDVHLTHSSPCRNAGDGSVATLPAEDFEGDPRTAGGGVDMGADEFHTHLYHTGAVAPGRVIDVKVVGTPGSAPVTLAWGSGVQDPPQATPYGDLHLVLPPLRTFNLGSIPQSGVRALSATVPASWQTGDAHPFQALIGPLGNPASVLTNLMVLTVD